MDSVTGFLALLSWFVSIARLLVLEAGSVGCVGGRKVKGDFCEQLKMRSERDSPTNFLPHSCRETEDDSVWRSRSVDFLSAYFVQPGVVRVGLITGACLVWELNKSPRLGRMVRGE